MLSRPSRSMKLESYYTSEVTREVVIPSCWCDRKGKTAAEIVLDLATKDKQR